MLTPFGIFSGWVNRSPGDLLNILSHSTHERHNAMLARTGHNFYFLPSAERHVWNKKNIDVPKNIQFIDKIEHNQRQLFDVIISQTLGQLSEDIKVAKAFNIPIILVHHCLRSATNVTSRKYWEQISKQCEVDYTVFITRSQAEDWWPDIWPNPVVIYHGVDTNVFDGWEDINSKKYILNVTNDFIGRGQVMGWDTLQAVCADLPVRCVGDTKHPNGTTFSLPANSLAELAQEYRSATVYFNVTRLSSISTSFLEAMATGVPCVTVDTFSIREFFNHEEHCLIFDEKDHDGMKTAIRAILDDPTKFKEMGLRARYRIMQIFSVENHVNQWNKLLYRVVNSKINPS